MLLFGHRGARHEAPENTMDGFAHAVGRGITALELDVRLTADGHLVVIHDATVDRTTDATGAVSDFSAAQLATLDARWPPGLAAPHWCAAARGGACGLRAHHPPGHRDQDRCAGST